MNPASPIPPVLESTPPADRLERFLRWVGLAFALGVGLLGVGIYAATGYFRPSPEMSGLRDSLQAAGSQSWQRLIHVKVGALTCGAVRTALGFAELDEEARIALQTIRRGEVGVYQVLENLAAEPAEMLAAADQAMRRHGWDRVVGVMAEDQLVAVYVPADINSTAHVKCAVLVCHGRQIILASADANLNPVLQLARARIKAG